MPRIIFIIFSILVLINTGCVMSQQSVDKDVQEFLLLLTADVDPSLSQYERFSGSGDPSELELAFELKKCKSMGLESDSIQCINFIRNRWENTDKEKSFFLEWLRNKFATRNSSYRIVDIDPNSEGFRHNIIKVEIGGNSFKLFHNTDKNRPTGLLVGVYEVNGKKIDDYF